MAKFANKRNGGKFMSDDNKTNWADFDEYLRQGEPDKQEKAYNWQTAIGLQAVDGLHTSDYLIDTARQHIEGDIDIDQVQQLLKTYYQSKANRAKDDDEKEEADRAAANITKILSRKTLAFNTNGYIAVHRQIFDGVFKHAGKLRDYDITKKEWVLRGDTVNYLNFEDLRRAIDYDIEQERQFDYKGMDMADVVTHITRFVSGLWQIHAFCEGNTRTTAVFTIQYLRSIGFYINNELFAKHSWYFRNALVRANYKNVQLGINYNHSFLEKFFRNLLMGEQNELKNRYMVITQPDDWDKKRPSSDQVATKLRASSDVESGIVFTSNENIRNLIYAIGEERKSVKDMMTAVGLKHRHNFAIKYLEPAIFEGYVERLYPDKLQHPRQKYFLTLKGKALLAELNIQQKKSMQ